jgi:hypothetical protein
MAILANRFGQSYVMSVSSVGSSANTSADVGQIGMHYIGA